MTVYNINLGIGWASSGVEYAQAYRASVFRENQIPAKFIFTDMIRTENIQHFTQHIGFKDEEVLWLYSFFTDVPISPSTYSLKDLESTFSHTVRSIDKGDAIQRYHFEETSLTVVAILVKDRPECVQRVEYLVDGNLVRKDYFTSTRLFTEYYYPKDQQARLHKRAFYNQDGSVAYEEYLDEKEKSLFRFPQHLCYTKEELFALMLERLQLTSQDILLLDRSTGIGQAVFRHKGAAKLAVVVHAEHFSPNAVTDDTILWNNYYEYQFSNADKVDAFITSTESQSQLLAEQFERYTDKRPVIKTIPVGSLTQLRYPKKGRKPYSLITASRLAAEKHIDWLVSAVLLAKQALPELTFDIYGAGGQEHKLREQIKVAQAETYIQLKGHHDLTDIYQEYAAYLSGSTSEGFGLTLMEAVGAGLPIIGLDVRYGNQTFIKDGENGYLIERPVPDDPKEMTMLFAQKIIQLFKEKNLEQVHEVSYQVASAYLEEHIKEKWERFVKELVADD